MGYLAMSQLHCVGRQVFDTSGGYLYGGLGIKGMEGGSVTFLVASSNIDLPRWHKPSSDFLKLNVDASFFIDELQTGIGMVLRNEGGEHVASKVLIREGLLQTDEGEAWEVLAAIMWAMELGVCNIIIETDTQLVRDAFSASSLDDSVFGDFVRTGKKIF